MEGEKKSRGGGIVRVSDLFEKYAKRLIAPESTVIEAFQDVISDLLSFEIDKKQCSYKSGSRTLIISTSGPVKSEILLRKKEIIAHLKGRLGEQNAPHEIL